MSENEVDRYDFGTSFKQCPSNKQRFLKDPRFMPHSKPVPYISPNVEEEENNFQKHEPKEKSAIPRIVENKASEDEAEDPHKRLIEPDVDNCVEEPPKLGSMEPADGDCTEQKEENHENSRESEGSENGNKQKLGNNEKINIEGENNENSNESTPKKEEENALLKSASKGSHHSQGQTKSDDNKLLLNKEDIKFTGTFSILPSELPDLVEKVRPRKGPSDEIDALEQKGGRPFEINLIRRRNQLGFQ